MSKSGGKQVQSSWQNTQQELDPYVQQIRQLFGSAGIAAANGPAPQLDAGVTDAQNYFRGVQNLGFGGQRVLSGDQGAIAAQMNPYLSQVVDATGQQYDKLRGQTTMNLNDQATKAGAFGGSRHGVAQGVALGELGAAQGQQVAGLLKGGYDDVMSRAQYAASLGFGGAQVGAQTGMQVSDWRTANSPEMRRFDILRGLLTSMPYTTNTSTQGKTKGTNTSWEISPESVGGWLGLAMGKLPGAPTGG